MNCPDPETLAQWLEGRLPEFGREALLEHLAGCDACREASLALVPDRAASERRIPLAGKRFPWAAWVAAASVLVAAGVVWRTLPTRVVEKPGEPAKVTKVFEPAPKDPAVQPLPDPTPPKPAPVPVPPPTPPTPDPTPRPDENPKPVPPVDPGPKPPPVDPAPKKPEPGPPTKALAALRVLDLQGKLLLDGVAAAEGALADHAMTSPDGAGFHVEGHLVVLAKGSSATISREGETYVMDVKKGEIFVEPRGTFAVRSGGNLVVLDSPALVTSSGAAPFRVKAAADKARARFASLIPSRRTQFFDDCSANPAGFVSAAAMGGPIVGTQVALTEKADWSKKLLVRVRCRTKAHTVQVGLVFGEGNTPWAGMATVSGGTWQEITLRASDFSAGPTGADAPKDGDVIRGITFAINTSEPGADGASLDIDDIALVLEE